MDPGAGKKVRIMGRGGVEKHAAPRRARRSLNDGGEMER